MGAGVLCEQPGCSTRWQLISSKHAGGSPVAKDLPEPEARSKNGKWVCLSFFKGALPFEGQHIKQSMVILGGMWGTQ